MRDSWKALTRSSDERKNGVRLNDGYSGLAAANAPALDLTVEAHSCGPKTPITGVCAPEVIVRVWSGPTSSSFTLGKFFEAPKMCSLTHSGMPRPVLTS